VRRGWLLPAKVLLALSLSQNVKEVHCDQFHKALLSDKTPKPRSTSKFLVAKTISKHLLSDKTQNHVRLQK
jgi:hypothetical protein